MIIPSSFKYNKYGLSVRLVVESDVSFILKLRTNEKLNRFLHATNSDVEAQKEWIRKYKGREKVGQEYYFIYFDGDVPIGLNRIYDIHDTWATSGSWICSPNIAFEKSIFTLIILREILFDILLKEKDCFDVRKGNRNVIWVHKKCGAKIVSENDIDFFLELKKEDFSQNKEKILSLLK